MRKGNFENQKVFVIANPAAGNGKVHRNKELYKTKVSSHFGTSKFLFTKQIGHGVSLAEEACHSGADIILSLGGDGTHNEVVNGIMRSGGAEKGVRLGVLPAGTGGDFRKILYESTSCADCLQQMTTGESIKVDVGTCKFNTHDGVQEERFFLNIASVGIGGLIDHLVNGSSKRLGGRASFLLGTLRALAQYKPPHVRVRVDGHEVFEGPVTNVLACNGRYAGGGMFLAPKAKLNDGKLDIVIIPDQKLPEQLLLTPRLYTGTYIKSSSILFRRGQVLEIETDPTEHRKAFMDIDGEAPGVAPATFGILPGALELLGVPKNVQVENEAAIPPTPTARS